MYIEAVHKLRKDVGGGSVEFPQTLTQREGGPIS